MWDQFFQKWYFCSKTEKINNVTEFHMLELLGFSSEKQKSKYHHPILHLKNSPILQFQLKQTILILLKSGIFILKQKK